MKIICDPEAKHCGSCPGCVLNADVSESTETPGSMAKDFGYKKIGVMEKLRGCTFTKYNKKNDLKDGEYDIYVKKQKP